MANQENKIIVENVELLQLTKNSDYRGNLTFIEGSRHLPFHIRRVYYLYDVPSQVSRAGHAHKKLLQVYIALSGSFDVRIDDGKSQLVVNLYRPDVGLFLGTMVWRELCNFSAGSVCLVLASDYYKESDYYRSYEDFRKAQGPS